MAHNDAETDALLAQAGHGDDQARQRLLERHRSRLKRMVAVRMDRRLTARLDPSDVVQEALTDAVRDLPNYLRSRPMGFYPWLRQLAWDRLLRLHRHHIGTGRRNVDREHADFLPLPDESALNLANRLVAAGTSPSGQMIRQELRERVRATLGRMPPRDREVLVLRYLEMLTNTEIAEVLAITKGAVKVRHFRALERFRSLIDDEPPGGMAVRESVNGILASSEVDPILVQLIDELADRLQAGESVDWASVAREHPQRVETVRKMLPVIAAMAELGSVTGRGRLRSLPLEFGPDSVMGDLGDFRILREIGRGGMGVVYEATQISLGRRVALKVLPFAPALNARQLQRFQNEARAAAHLNHVNIVPVYAVGCERGVHYYAMQFIDGQSLSVVVEDLRRIEERPVEDPVGRSEDAFVLASKLASGRFAPGVTTTERAQQTVLQGSDRSGPVGAVAAPSSPTIRTTSAGSSTRSSAYFRTVARMGTQAAGALEHAPNRG